MLVKDFWHWAYSGISVHVGYIMIIFAEVSTNSIQFRSSKKTYRALAVFQGLSLGGAASHIAGVRGGGSVLVTFAIKINRKKMNRWK